MIQRKPQPVPFWSKLFYLIPEVDAIIDSYEKENKRLKKALFTALALMARNRKYWFSELLKQESCKISPHPKFVKRYTQKSNICQKAELKLRANAEEYK